MRHLATTLMLGLILASFFPNAAAAQGRTDVIWARDVEGATMTLDGLMDEAAWGQAASLSLQWNLNLGEPGSGQKIEGDPALAEPTDPNDGTLYVLRDGNTLWLAVQVNDKSIGGGRGLNAGNWWFDGLIMSLKDRSRFDPDPAANNYFANGDNAEFIYSWWNPADTLDGGLPIPGIAPRPFGTYGVGFPEGNDGPSRTPEDVAIWDAVTTVDGTVNEINDDDVGYLMEMRIDLAALGYDMTQPGGDRVGWNIALQDADYLWPRSADFFVSRVWWQNQWANNFNHGVAYIAGGPDVTLTSGAVPDVAPDYLITNGEGFADPVIDGSLDDDVWGALSAPNATLKYRDFDAIQVPGLGDYSVSYFRPDLNGAEPDPPVLDPSLASFYLFFKGNFLYVGVDVEDQAIAGLSGEGGDGFRLTISHRDSVRTDGTLFPFQFIFNVDSTGAVRLSGDAATLAAQDPTSLSAAAAVKGASTPADPTDVDEGYQVEIQLDLTKTLGYPDGRGDGLIWLTANFFDGDYFEDPANDYTYRLWYGRERAEGAGPWGFMDPNAPVGTAVEGPAEVPARIALLGNYPNPFNPSTTLRFALPQAGEVTLQVFDLLGRRVATMALGARAAGLNEARFDAAGLPSGLYVYRLEVKDLLTGALRSDAAGRMVLVK